MPNNNMVNQTQLAYTLKLGLQVYRTNIGVQKIDGSILETFEIVLRISFFNLQQYRYSVCQEKTYLEVLYCRQGSTNYQANRAD